MKRQLQGIAVILVSILLMIGFGDVSIFDLSAHWSAVFAGSGIAGLVWAFLPEKKE